MSAVLNEAPTSLNSHTSGASVPSVGQEKVRVDVVLGGSRDIEERIIAALAANAGTVRLRRYSYNRARLCARCSASWDGRRVFAKILLANPYPVPKRFTGPWDPPDIGGMPVRAVDKQIETEWSLNRQMLAFSEGRSVPKPLGRSVAARTIVWEEASGMPVIGLLRQSLWKPAMAKAGAQALFQAGIWLRAVHNASSRGEHVDVSLLDSVPIASGSASQKRSDASRYTRIACEIMQAFLSEMGSAKALTIPVAFTHGDFCLSNLLWDSAQRRLAVTDFELASFRPICHDLFALAADLKSMLLNPFIPKKVIGSWEDSFWRGYGSISPQVKAFVRALALARVFYHHLIRSLSRGERTGWVGGVIAGLYRTVLEREIISYRLGVPLALTEFRPN